jgi:hypothetical protein
MAIFSALVPALRRNDGHGSGHGYGRSGYGRSGYGHGRSGHGHGRSGHGHGGRY